ncbi:HlyD family type I secretion periplasmic adaptor subunit [Desulfosoma caldarium]|uniref:HlyD family secretion protein/protease secretion system membrane fusion protein/epimerase transport system membrane fusion protein n=1 Tax=Desulfosoma caldarium TaxID=610254 RepID=A0A3N1VTU2_9BACT|nr:HlyD family type I secretion periplasmic adaptor subunit [Desulfosoma caldarium]ROR03197.1 HlyD family secretion protein/protease secretion system membrane fusion protein/epimerase transport system membrane fusion protein [Desulfosoma caldarium]
MEEGIKLTGPTSGDVASDYWKPVRVGLGFVVLFGLTFVLWAVLAPIQLGAVAMGQVTAATFTKVVQHPYGGTVKDILVQDGDAVDKGQVLIRLEDATARAQYAQVYSEYLQALVVRARLEAEKAGLERIQYPEEVRRMEHDPVIRGVMRAQEELFRVRRAKRADEKQVLQRNLEGYREAAANLKVQARALERQAELLGEQIQAVSVLAEDGYYPRNRLLDLQRSLEAVRANLSEVVTSRARMEASARETEARLQALESEQAREVEDQLAEVVKRLMALQDQFAAVQDHLEKTEIRAPEAGIVMNLRVRSVGAVISPGQGILQIVPKGASFVVEAKVSTQDIEDVQVGSEAILRFMAINPKTSPTFDGTVLYVSPDVQYDEVHRVPYYLCRVSIPPETVEKIAAMGKEIIPGMPVMVIVKKASTTFFAWLWKPFTDRMAIAFTR